jgi:hypothetical protein
MQAFRAAMVQRIPRIKRAGYLDEVRVESGASGEFTFVCIWTKGSKGPGQHRKTYTRRMVLGRTINSPPLQQRAGKPCQEAMKLIQEILRMRGV